MGILEPLGPDEWTGLMVSHAYMGPVPAFFYAAGQLMDYGVHSWDIRQGTGRGARAAGRRRRPAGAVHVRDLAGHRRAPTRSTEPFEIGHPGHRPQRRRLPGLGQREGPRVRAGRHRGPAGADRVRRGQPGAHRVRPGQLRHRTGRLRRWPTGTSTCSSASERRGRPGRFAGRPQDSASYSPVGVPGRQPVPGHPRGRRPRQGIELLPEPRHLERGQPLRRPLPQRGEVRRPSRLPGRRTP